MRAELDTAPRGARGRGTRPALEPLARALGLHRRRRELDVVDATAGLGRDAATLARLGASVRCIERHPVPHALLADALARLARAEAASGEDAAPPLSQRLHLVEGDAHAWLARPPGTADVVLLDPMFPADGRTALAGKDLQLLSRAVGAHADDDADALLDLARALARDRVVVKRPRAAPPLAGVTPDAVQRGRAMRFDVYLAPR